MVYSQRSWLSTYIGDGWHDVGGGTYRGEGWHDAGGGPYYVTDLKCWIISLDNVSLLWFGSPPSLPLRCEMASLRVLYVRLTISMNTDYLNGDYDRLYMEYWNLWKASDRFFEDTTFGRMSFLLFPFLPLHFISYSPPPVYTALLYQLWGILTNYNQGSSWWLYHFPISPYFFSVSPYIISSFIESGWWFVSSQRHKLQLGGQCSLMIVDYPFIIGEP